MNLEIMKQRSSWLGWPPDIVMTPEVKALVDRKWAEYGLG